MYACVNCGCSGASFSCAYMDRHDADVYLCGGCYRDNRGICYACELDVPREPEPEYPDCPEFGTTD